MISGVGFRLYEVSIRESGIGCRVFHYRLKVYLTDVVHGPLAPRRRHGECATSASVC
jgi:hypothetical protein